MLAEEQPISPDVLRNHPLAAHFPGLGIIEVVAGSGAESTEVSLLAGKGLSAALTMPPIWGLIICAQLPGGLYGNQKGHDGTSGRGTPLFLQNAPVL